MRFLAWIMIALASLWSADATIDVIKTTQKLPMMSVEDASINYTKYLSKKFHKVLAGDMHVVSQFNVVDEYIQSDYVADMPNKGAEQSDFVLKYRLKESAEGLMLCDMKLIDTKAQRSVFTRQYKITQQDLYVFLAHEIAADINDFFKFEPIGWIKKRVLFARYINPKESEIVISDYTLSYQKVIIRGGLNIFPKWADAKQVSFFYTAYKDKPTLYRYNILTGEEERIIDSDGMLVCSDIDKNFEKIVLSMAPKGQPDIYIYDLKNKSLEQVTRYNGIDVSGQFLDDGKRIAFVSDRLGYPNIFAQVIGENSVEQLVYYGKNNNSCSTYQNYIVYTSRESDNEFSQNSFNLHLISTKTEYVRHLTATGVNQYPKFSEDGSAIIFIKHFKRQSALGIIRLHANKSFLFPLKVGQIQSLDW
ncbi:MAG: hypothetical protein KU37_11245 [Sulfuricurvum sp. PC08-66]|nr:MAG: hypothetical protein KU37_11245 [Sulfuricurvum sp. PC08-66]